MIGEDAAVGTFLIVNGAHGRLLPGLGSGTGSRRLMQFQLDQQKAAAFSIAYTSSEAGQVAAV
jgi:hypothetical protein